MVPETIEPIELAEAARERYLRYAMSVITSRALPDVRDGLKPVQRRILYAMGHDLNISPTSRPMKCARVVGEVMGKYHPHGDSAIYDALVRMAQPFSLRYPLVDGHGNFGAITGDSAAAFRYTEARLHPLGSELLETLGEETVEFRATYDESGREPEVVPSPVPLLLLNGASGIAVGMSTNIPPHNLREVVKAAAALIDKPDLTVAQLMRSLKGPDFPTGGELLASRDELRAIYENGVGSVKLRGTYRIEEVKGKTQRLARTHLVVDSIPYGSNTGQVLAKIKELVEARKLPQVAQVSDQTNEEDGVRLVLELRPDADADPAAIMAAVYRLTPLETTYPINMTALFPTGPGRLGRPERHADLRALLKAWLDFRFDVVTRSIQYRKARLEERIHILQGLAAVLARVDDAIKLVRGAKDRADARQKLMARFDLSEAQANAVLELQLYRLARLEVKKVKEELAEKEKEAARLGALLRGTKPRWELIKKQLEAAAKRHGDARRTTLVGAADAEHQYDPTALIKKEDTHVVVTREGRLKRIRRLEDTERLRLRDGDELLAVLQGSTLATVVLFTNFGSAYTMPVSDVPPTAGFGEPVQKFFGFKDQERLVAALSLDERVLAAPAAKVALLTATRGGMLVSTALTPYLEPSNRAGRRFVRLIGKDEVVAVEALGPSRKKRWVLLATNKGNALRVALEDVPAVSGVGKGRQGIELGKKEEVVGATAREVLELENTRGGAVALRAADVAAGELGGAGEDASGRFGFRRALPPAPELLELEGDDGEEG